MVNKIKVHHQYGPQRREALLSFLKLHPEHDKVDAIFLVGNPSLPEMPYIYDNWMYYYTGITDPGVCLIIDRNSGKSTVFLPQYDYDRKIWDSISEGKFLDNALEVCPAGAPFKNGHVCWFPRSNHYDTVIQAIQERVNAGKAIACVASRTASGSNTYSWLAHAGIIGLDERTISSIHLVAAYQRSCKSSAEIAAIKDAARITQMAHAGVMSILEDGLSEIDLMMCIKGLFAQEGAHEAFPSIVAFGKSASVLHHTPDRMYKMHQNGLVLVDIGAKFNGYCADISRTYPVSGKFNEKLSKWYDIVAQAHAYALSIVKPGMFLYSSDNPDQSIHHLVHAFFQKYNVSDLFPHRIGHFLGLDVHDVGDYARPLQEGMVITIEPGLYNSHEGWGIRLEDNIVLHPKGYTLLSDELPIERKKIVPLMESMQEMQDDDDDYFDE